MRESQSLLAAMLMPDPSYYDSEGMPPTAAAGDPNYLSAMEKTGWLRHVSLVLSASVWCAKKMTFEGASVLVHCSDGWDRTAQVCMREGGVVSLSLFEPGSRPRLSTAALDPGSLPFCPEPHPHAEPPPPPPPPP